MKFSVDHSRNWPHVRFGDTSTWPVTDHGELGLIYKLTHDNLAWTILGFTIGLFIGWLFL